MFTVDSFAVPADLVLLRISSRKTKNFACLMWHIGNKSGKNQPPEISFHPDIDYQNSEMFSSQFLSPSLLTFSRGKCKSSLKSLSRLFQLSGETFMLSVL